MINYILLPILLVVGLIISLVYRRNHTTRYGAPFVPLEPDVVANIIKLARIKKGDIFFDLGSGDGRLVIAAAMSGANAYGVEIDPLRVWYSRLWIRVWGLKSKATIIHKNVFDVDLSNANIITAYLLQETNNNLMAKLKREVKKGTRVVGIAFNFPEWKPTIIDKRGPIYGPLYLYER
jgi:predicted RNA methylase